MKIAKQNSVQRLKKMLVRALGSGTHTSLPLLEIFLSVVPRFLSI